MSAVLNSLLKIVSGILPLIVDIAIWDIYNYRKHLSSDWGANPDTADSINIFNSMILFTVSMLIAGLDSFEIGGWVLIIIAFFLSWGAFILAKSKSQSKRKYRKIILALVFIIVVANRYFLIMQETTPPIEPQ